MHAVKSLRIFPTGMVKYASLFYLWRPKKITDCLSSFSVFSQNTFIVYIFGLTAGRTKILGVFASDLSIICGTKIIGFKAGRSKEGVIG